MEKILIDDIVPILVIMIVVSFHSLTMTNDKG